MAAANCRMLLSSHFSRSNTTSGILSTLGVEGGWLSLGDIWFCSLSKNIAAMSIKPLVYVFFFFFFFFFFKN